MSTAAFDGLTPLEIFRRIAPEFASVPDDVVKSQIDLASLILCECDYGKDWNAAQAMGAAHLLSTNESLTGGDSGAASGAVLSRKEGDLEIRYAAPSSSGSGGGFSGSSYADMLALLKRKKGRGFGIITSGVWGC